MSAENKNENGELSKESLVESFNKHYTDYLDRYSTNRRAVQPEKASDDVVSEPTEPLVEDEDLFFIPESAESVVTVTTEPVANVVEPEMVTDVSAELFVEPEITPAPKKSPFPAFASEPDLDLAEISEDEEDTDPADDNFLPDGEEEDYFFLPDEAGVSIEEEPEVGFYEPERPKDEVPEPAPEPAQNVVEREVIREVLVVDREQARDLGYGADRYMDSQPAPAPAADPFRVAQNQPAPAPARTERAVERNVEVRDDRGSRPADYSRPAERRVSESHPLDRSSEKPSFFGGLFKRGRETTEVSDVNAFGSDVSDYKERSRIKEEGLDADFLGMESENNVISLKTQDDYDPREERRRLQHVTTEQREVDPAGWLEQTMLDALKMDASDLHIVVDGETKDLRARIRVDGQMQDFDFVTGIPAKVIMGRLKAATKLSSGGSYAPEETIYEIELDGEKRKARAVLFRVEDGGEALVMRLPLTGNLRQLDELAFSEANLEHVLALLAMPYKLIMIAGPMGSGKTTTAHGALLHVADPTRTVWTIEDPVERRLPNLVQLEIDEENGAGFDVLLGKLLRADYNTLFLGEIRDSPTAAAAVRQAKAGRQVMSTIHADDNIKSLMRLVELAGDSPMSVLSAVGGVISQRLVRRLNTDWDGVDPAKKYKGRIPIHEILFINDSIVEVMMQDRPLSEIKQQVRSARGSTFLDDAVRLIEAGVTDREEVVKVIGEFDADDRY